LSHLSETQVLRFVIQLALLLACGRALGDLMKRIGQAAVVGELLAGVMLGPSVLGTVAPGVFNAIFGGDALPGHLLEGFAWIGAILLLLFVGLETDLDILRGQSRATAHVSIWGIVIPLAAGMGLGMLLPAHYLVAPEQRLIFALFMAVAIAISAVPVIAKILIELGLMRRELGMLILAAGFIEDTVGWLLLSVVAGIAEGRALSAVSFSILLIESAAFIALCYFVGVPLVGRFMRWVDDRGAIEHAKFSAMLLAGFACAIIAQIIGLNVVFGAFVAGLMLSRTPRARSRDRSELEAVTMGLMAPVFFGYSGLHADLSALRSPLIPLIVLAVACVSKIGGCLLGGALGRLKFRESLAVALGMNARGGMGIIVALLGLSLRVLSPEMYTVVIAVAVVTSVISPPLLKWSLSGVSMRPGDAERAERERMMARLPLRVEGAKLLVLSGGGPHAELATHLAATLGTSSHASITVFHAMTGNGREASSAFEAESARLRGIATAAGAANVYQRMGGGESVVDAVIQESERGYDAVFVGASHVHGHDVLRGEVLRGLLSTVRAPVVIARAGTAIPLHRVLMPVSAASWARVGAAVGMLYAQAAGAEATALYVCRRPIFTLRAPGGVVRRSAEDDEAEEVIGEVRKLGAQLGVEIAARIDAGPNPESVILRILRGGEFDLLVMGALFRSTEQRLYFGRRVDQILREVPSAVAVVVPPATSQRA
jgi:Kef-type K+ transport system membrane component KefB